MLLYYNIIDCYFTIYNIILLLLILNNVTLLCIIYYVIVLLLGLYIFCNFIIYNTMLFHILI